MKEICVLGNSHAGPLRRIVDEQRLRLHEPTRFTFFLCHVTRLPDIEIAGCVLRPAKEDLAELFRSTSRGRSAIDIDEFDEFIIVGQGFSIYRLVHQAQRYRSDSLRGPRDQRYLLSDDCFIACAAQQLDRGEAMRIAQLIRSATDKPVTVVAEPNLGVGLSKSDVPWWLHPYYDAVEEDEADAMGRLFGNVCRSLADTRSIRIVPPAAEMAVNGLFNHREFCMLTECPPDAPNADRVNSMLHGNWTSAVPLVRQLFGDTATIEGDEHAAR